VNPSTALARVLVDELLRGGVRETVLAPGSRSAPLAFALHAAEVEGRLRLHVRIDERSAGFLALGLAKGSGSPVVVVTTSGTAAVNLHPAVVEASHSGTPVLVLTADRPPELRATGANQSIEQTRLYGDAVRLYAEIGALGERAGDNAYWRSLMCRALAACRGELTGAPGPVQLNVGLREPLTPDDDPAWVEPLTGRVDGAPWTARVAAPAPGPVPGDLPARTVVVLGDGEPGPARAALRLAEARGFPVVAEPSAGARDSACLVAAPDLLVGVEAFVDAHRPDRVLVVGRPTLSRPVGRLIAGAPCDVVQQRCSWPDTSRTAMRVLPGVPVAGEDVSRDGSWLVTWLEAGRTAAAVRDRHLASVSGLVEPAVAAELTRLAPPLLMVGSSKPVRDLLLVGAPARTRVLANRGAAGIDGLVSSAIGMALADPHVSAQAPAYALLGDLSFLHDVNGLLLGPDEPRPHLTIVVVNNDGGAIFGLLEQGAPRHAEAFERLFGTPHGVDLATLCAATHTPHARVETARELAEALAPAPGLRVVEARTDRTRAVAFDRELRTAVRRALGAAS